APERSSAATCEPESPRRAVPSLFSPGGVRPGPVGSRLSVLTCTAAPPWPQRHFVAPHARLHGARRCHGGVEPGEALYRGREGRWTLSSRPVPPAPGQRPERSGTCLKNSTSTNPTTAIGTPSWNTVCIELLNAVTTASWAAAGSEWIASGEPSADSETSGTAGACCPAAAACSARCPASSA